MYRQWHVLRELRPAWDEWEFRVFPPVGNFVEIGSRRRFGVELETSKCPDHEDIRDDTCFGCKEDGSIDGKEFISPPLSSDRGLEAIRHFCEVAQKFEVDKKCGFHLHLDMTGESVESVKSGDCLCSY